MALPGEGSCDNISQDGSYDKICQVDGLNSSCLYDNISQVENNDNIFLVDGNSSSSTSDNISQAEKYDNICQADGNDSCASAASSVGSYDTDDEIDSEPVRAVLVPAQPQPGQPFSLEVGNSDREDAPSSLPLTMVANFRSPYNKVLLRSMA